MTTQVYIDTSVIGGCIDKEFKEWSIKLFDEFKNGNKIAVISDITLDDVTVLSSWNFKHIVNLDRIRKYNSVNIEMGFNFLEIRSPRDILKVE